MGDFFSEASKIAQKYPFRRRKREQFSHAARKRDEAATTTILDKTKIKEKDDVSSKQTNQAQAYSAVLTNKWGKWQLYFRWSILPITEQTTSRKQINSQTQLHSCNCDKKAQHFFQE